MVLSVLYLATAIGKHLFFNLSFYSYDFSEAIRVYKLGLDYFASSINVRAFTLKSNVLLASFRSLSALLYLEEARQSFFSLTVEAKNMAEF